MDNKQETIKEVTEELFKKLDIGIGFEVLQKEDFYLVNIKDGDDLGILIGYHGRTLNSLQLILGLLVYRKLGEWVNITVDAGNFRKEREEKLREVAMSAAQKARFLQKSIDLYPMPSFERRIVHSVINELAGVKSESEGEGYLRHVVVKPT